MSTRWPNRNDFVIPNLTCTSDAAFRITSVITIAAIACCIRIVLAKWFPNCTHRIKVASKCCLVSRAACSKSAYFAHFYYFIALDWQCRTPCSTGHIISIMTNTSFIVNCFSWSKSFNIPIHRVCCSTWEKIISEGTGHRKVWWLQINVTHSPFLIQYLNINLILDFVILGIEIIWPLQKWLC